MDVPLLAVTDEPLGLNALLAALEAAQRQVGEGCGALGTFVGVVRRTHKGRQVRYLEYEAHVPLTLRAFEIIAAETSALWPDVRLGIHHRIGRIEIGDSSVVVAAASAHRDQAFRACRYAIERVKQIAPIWKHEFFVDGEDWVEGPVADPADEALRRTALACACT
jgi:molybdopterin synthase catalytic subunit